MTGLRRGNPKRKRTRGICRSCGQDRHFKARRLCETCWAYAKKLGVLDDFPRIYGRSLVKIDGQRVMERCGCFMPIEEPIGVWGVQCLKCKKPIVK